MVNFLLCRPFWVSYCYVDYYSVGERCRIILRNLLRRAPIRRLSDRSHGRYLRPAVGVAAMPGRRQATAFHRRPLARRDHRRRLWPPDGLSDGLVEQSNRKPVLTPPECRRLVTEDGMRAADIPSEDKRWRRVRALDAGVAIIGRLWPSACAPRLPSVTDSATMPAGSPHPEPATTPVGIDVPGARRYDQEGAQYAKEMVQWGRAGFAEPAQKTCGGWGNCPIESFGRC